MVQEASNGALWNVLRGRCAAPQDEGTGVCVRLLQIDEEEIGVSAYRVGTGCSPR